MLKTIRPTSEEKRVIRKFAQKLCRKLGARLHHTKAGVRFNLDDESMGYHSNILLVTRDRVGYSDTELFQTMPAHEEMRKITLTPDGYAEFDLYLYSRDGLEDNMQVGFDAEGMTYIKRGLGEILWKRDGYNGPTFSERFA